jgi:CRISPR-associated protein Csb1
LIAFTHAQPYNLRQGCLLVRDPEKKAVTKCVYYNGTEQNVAFESAEVLAYAQEAAKEFGVGKRRTVQFDAAVANKAIREREEDSGGKATKMKGKRRRRA